MLSLNRSEIPPHLLRFFKPQRVYKPKDDAMIPHRVYDALMADGWYGRSDVVWAKKAPMPESVTDRPTRSHEYIFLLSKSARYFYDSTAVAEPSVYSGPPKPWRQAIITSTGGKTSMALGEGNPAGRNQRSVWHLGPESYPDAHFATFVTEIPRRAILAGTSERGCCPACLAPWRRVVERERGDQEAYARPKHLQSAKSGLSLSGNGSKEWAERGARAKTTGLAATCACEAGDPIPCTVLDPFLGSGTTLMVADRLSRDGIGIELNEQYAAQARRRITGDAPMFALVSDG